MRRTLALVLPYAAWMALMSVLPQTAWAYALRGVVTAALLAVGGFLLRRGKSASPPLAVGACASPPLAVGACASLPIEDGYCASLPIVSGSQRGRDTLVASFKGIIPGLLVGLLVFAVWIAPEGWVWSAAVPPSAAGATSPGATSPYAPATCGWTLTLAKLAASAFVISVAEELFFRKWLVEFAGFGWMLVLFGVEHMRWDLGVARGSVFIAEGVFAGLCYGLLAKKYGILSAVVAHAVTNLILGLYIIGWDKWFYW